MTNKNKISSLIEEKESFWEFNNGKTTESQVFVF